MKFVYSIHYLESEEFRSEITEYMLEYCIIHSEKIKDRRWEDVWNAITRIPPSNRTLKVAYKTEGKTIKILTAYWLD